MNDKGRKEDDVVRLETKELNPGEGPRWSDRGGDQVRRPAPLRSGGAKREDQS